LENQNPRTCLSCGAPLVAFETTLKGETAMTWECVEDDCDLCHSLQPVEGSRAGGGPLGDGRSRTRRLGAESSNEGNLDRVSRHLEAQLPDGYRVVSEDLHPSVDLAIECQHCRARLNVQVVRAIDADLVEKAARSTSMVWKDGSLEDRWDFVLKAIKDKSARYGADDRGKMVLIVDPEPDLSLALLSVKKGRSPREAALSLREQVDSWHGVAVLSFPHRLSWLSTCKSLVPCGCGEQDQTGFSHV